MIEAKIEPGREIPSKTMPTVDLSMLKAYAQASGDYNPIHQDEEIARKMGLPGIIAHGMLTSGWIADRAVRFVEDECGLKGWKLSRYQNRFKAMTFLGDVISIGGSVREANEQTIRLDLTAKNQKGENTTLGSAWFARA